MVQNELHIRGSNFSTIAEMLVYFEVALFFFSLYTSNPLLIILRKTMLRWHGRKQISLKDILTLIS